MFYRFIAYKDYRESTLIGVSAETLARVDRLECLDVRDGDRSCQGPEWKTPANFPEP
jgi:hypothetical protein